MDGMTKDALILRIANLLIGKKVESKAIVEALKEISNYFDFENSMIYEIDQYNQFNLKENIVLNNTKLKEFFLLSDFRPEDINQLIEDKNVYYCHQSRSKEGRSVCDIFDVNFVVVYPVVDNTKKILGLIVFSAQEEMVLNKENLNILHIALSLLAKYAGKRMHENKVNFAIGSLESILDNTGIDIYVNDFYTHEILYVNKSMAAPYGGAKEFMDRKCWEVLFPSQKGPCEFCPQKKLVDENGEITKVYVWDYQRSFDGSWFRVFSSAFRWIDGRLAHVVSSADITDNKKYEALIHHMANYDSLTNLPNRRMMIEDCEKHINNASSTEKGYLLFFDIDGFKSINDNYGHDAGDEFLVQLAIFFSEIPMLKNAIYRNGGDEFVAIIGGEEISKIDIRNLARFIQQRFSKPWKLKKGNVHCGVSIGVACFPEDGKDAEVLIHKADQAMYHVKKQGGSNVCFGYELNTENKEDH